MTALDGPVLITGGAGFIGSNLADAIASDGRDVLIYDALARPGVERNLAWLKGKHGRKIRSVVADIRDAAAVRDAARDASAVFHFAAQVAVTTSMVDPMDDHGINILGTLNVLEALRRRNDPAPVVFASTNKVYGDLADVDLVVENDAYTPSDPTLRGGVSEKRALDFHTPYGCSKGAADQYVLDYSRSFGLATCVLRMSCIYGPRQMGTEDQGWVAHFLIRALKGQSITLYGDGRQVRDVMHVRDAIGAYIAAWRAVDRVNGRAFNLGGGASNAVSLRQVLRAIEDLTGRCVPTASQSWRPGDQRYYVSDIAAAREALNLPQPMDWRLGLEDLADWLGSAEGPLAERARPLVGATP